MNQDFTHIDEFLERCLDGELNDQEKAQVNKILQENQEANQKFDALKLAVEAIRLNGLTDRVGSIAKEYSLNNQVETKIETKGRVRSIGYYAVRVAAVLVVMLGSYTFMLYSTTSADKIFADSYVPYELPASRSTSQSSDLEKLYVQAQWNRVLDLMQPLEDRTQKELFLGGMAALQSGKNPTAKQIFEKLMDNNKKNNEQSFQDEAQFYLALTYVKLGEYDKAQNLFELIRNDYRHAYHNQVSRMELFKLKLLNWKK